MYQIIPVIFIQSAHLASGENNGGQLGAIAPLGQERHCEGLGQDAHGEVGGTSFLWTTTTALGVIHQRRVHITIQL